MTLQSKQAEQSLPFQPSLPKQILNLELSVPSLGSKTTTLSIVLGCLLFSIFLPTQVDHVYTVQGFMRDGQLLESQEIDKMYDAQRVYISSEPSLMDFQPTYSVRSCTRSL
jgi:hypothetical protein